MSTPSIQWYPGHIAKAEKALQEQLKRVDVVLDVRDARIPLATSHPQVHQWIGSKESILVINRLDMIPERLRQRWTVWFQAQGQDPYFTDAQHGKGIQLVLKAAQTAGEQMNRRRRQRGMLPRPVRAVVVGFPNVGKSALINRLLNRRVVESARRPGVTRQLRWVRISDQIELLDAPGVLPSRLDNQDAALKLAICDDIGQAGYDTQRVAAALIDLLSHYQTDSALANRYGLAVEELSGESYLHRLADQCYQGDVERTARQILTDFRKGELGAIPLEYPPE
ncbi:MAG: ribosome biogenesis GTPase YlqF [Leptolyngbyaceae cyanobacterium]